jgi:pimeloyl-ACP methyl ester carboxylesterase
MSSRLLLPLLSLLCLAGAAAPADPLPRRAPLQVAPAPPGQAEGPGVGIAKVAPGGTGDALGLKAGDRVLVINEAPVDDVEALVRESGRLQAGKPARLEVLREGKRMKLAGRGVGRPLESYPRATVRYGAVPFKGGWLRDIYVAPRPDYDGPVVWYIQGYPCSSIESPLYRPFVGAMAERNIAVYRVEKLLVGDSEGTPDCKKADFEGEVAGFQAAYDHLVGTMRIDPDRIFILGHSMGGIEAPFIAARAKVPPRGIAVYGTGLRNWHDYMMSIFAFQSFEMFGSDPVEDAAKAEALRPLIYDLFFGDRSLEQIAASSPERAEALREIGWEGGDVFTGRSFRFWRQLAHIKPAEAWRDSKSRVLSLFGESDMVAYDSDDQRLIAEIVNHYRPGTAEFRTVPDTEHLMLKAGSRAEIRRRNQIQPPPPPAEFNPDVAERIARWIGESMRLPPVRLLASRDVSPAPR